MRADVANRLFDRFEVVSNRRPRLDDQRPDRFHSKSSSGCPFTLGTTPMCVGHFQNRQQVFQLAGCALLVSGGEDRQEALVGDWRWAALTCSGRRQDLGRVVSDPRMGGVGTPVFGSDPPSLMAGIGLACSTPTCIGESLQASTAPAIVGTTQGVGFMPA